jgi:hypothetical protein
MKAFSILLLFVAVSAQAQQKLHLKIGGGAADFRESHNPIFCPVAGLLAENPLNDHLKITLGTYWKRKGVRDKINDSLIVSVPLHYAQFELGCQYVASTGMRFGAGCYVGANADASVLVKLNGDKKRTKTFPFEEGFTNDIGLFFEAGIMGANDRVGLSFQYDLGLNNVSEATTYRTRAITACLVIPLYIYNE